MTPNDTGRDAIVIRLLLPVVVIILGFTAVPEHISLSTAAAEGLLDLPAVDLVDIAANVLLFVPLGLVLGGRRRRSVVLIALAISAFAELSQMLTELRTPSVLDVVTNVAGALLGHLIAGRLSWRTDRLAVTRRGALLSLSLVMAGLFVGTRVTPTEAELFFQSWLTSSPEPSSRGTDLPGRLEGRWGFDRDDGETVFDHSANRLVGRAVGNPERTQGVEGAALALDGATQFVELGDSRAVRLEGSTTLAAWIKIDEPPPDDGPIISSLDLFTNGYQLDTTIDTGPRVIGFKLGNEDGHLMARYGLTPLETDTWYHVAGVYDASQRSLSVYLDGRLDSGCLAGSVTSRQRPSDAGLYFGRRATPANYWFSGSIDDVRLYSSALSAAEISEIVAESGHQVSAADPSPGTEIACPERRNPPDPRANGLVLALGCLAAVAALGLGSTRRHPVVVASIAGLGAGLAFSIILGIDLVSTDVTWPAHIPPPLGLIGGLAVGVSIERERPGDTLDRTGGGTADDHARAQSGTELATSVDEG